MHVATNACLRVGDIARRVQGGRGLLDRGDSDPSTRKFLEITDPRAHGIGIGTRSRRRSKRTAMRAYRCRQSYGPRIDYPSANASAVHARPGLWMLTKLWTTTCTSRRPHASGRWLPHSFLNCRARAQRGPRCAPVHSAAQALLPRQFSLFGDAGSRDVGLHEAGCCPRIRNRSPVLFSGTSFRILHRTTQAMIVLSARHAGRARAWLEH